MKVANTKLPASFVSVIAIVLSLVTPSFLMPRTDGYPDSEVTIIGGGIAGALHAYQAHKDSIKNGTKARVTICEKNKSIADTTTLNVVFSLTPDEILAVIPRGSELMRKLQIAFNQPGGLRVSGFNDRFTTTANIVPSLTPDEILCVVPRGRALVDKLQSAFHQPNGIRVDDVSNINDSMIAKQFIQQVEIYSHDTAGYNDRTKTLLALGKMSMDLWQEMYDQADAELKEILISSNFNPCHESSKNSTRVLRDGYRIDLIYNYPQAINKALDMKADYESLGYTNCSLLSPSEVMGLDPFLTDFCKGHSTMDGTGTLQWNSDSTAIWRPGGCIDTKIFLPKFYEYLKKVMGTYVDETGKTQSCFQILYEREVRGIIQEKHNDQTIVGGLNLGNGFYKLNDKSCDSSTYVFCPGEAVGTLQKLGLKEPAYAGFAGVSLLLNIPLPEHIAEKYKSFNHCMEVQQEGVILAWQARYIDGKIFIGVAGTKAFYGDQRPTKDQAFAKDRNLLQLNMINDVLPEFMSFALGRNSTGQKLSQADMDFLEQKEIAKRWAGVRAVVFDGFPTLGMAYGADGKELVNTLVTTHLGSGGVSFGPAAVAVSCNALSRSASGNPLVDAVLNFAKSNRVAQ